MKIRTESPGDSGLFVACVPHPLPIPQRNKNKGRDWVFYFSALRLLSLLLLP